MFNDTIVYYSKKPFQKFELSDFDISYWEQNRTCGDDLKVFIKFDGDKIKDWSFTGDTAIITTAAASVFGESIIGMKLSEILEKDYFYIEEIIGMQISEKRKQASVLALLTTRNAIHEYLKDGKKDTFEDILL